MKRKAKMAKRGTAERAGLERAVTEVLAVFETVYRARGQVGETPREAAFGSLWRPSVINWHEVILS